MKQETGEKRQLIHGGWKVSDFQGAELIKSIYNFHEMTVP